MIYSSTMWISHIQRISRQLHEVLEVGFLSLKGAQPALQPCQRRVGQSDLHARHRRSLCGLQGQTRLL